MSHRLKRQETRKFVLFWHLKSWNFQQGHTKSRDEQMEKWLHGNFSSRHKLSLCPWISFKKSWFSWSDNQNVLYIHVNLSNLLFLLRHNFNVYCINVLFVCDYYKIYIWNHILTFKNIIIWRKSVNRINMQTDIIRIYFFCINKVNIQNQKSYKKIFNIDK